MPSSGTLRHVALVRTDVSEEPSASIIRVTRIGELGMLAVTSKRHTLRRNTNLIMEALHSSEMSVLIRTTWHNIPEDGILHSHRHENLSQSYKFKIYVLQSKRTKEFNLFFFLLFKKLS
jgi:hypothetical protein